MRHTAFFDFTVPVKREILERLPHLAAPPPDAPLGLDTPLPPPPDVSWEGRGNLVPINPPNPDEEPDQALPDTSTSAWSARPEESDENHVTTWHDVALSIGAELMMKSRMEVKHRLGYTTSAVRTSCNPTVGRLIITPGNCTKQNACQGKSQVSRSIIASD